MSTTKVLEAVFYESDKLPFSMLEHAVHEWFMFNKDKIKIISITHRVDKKEKFLNNFRRSIYVKYANKNAVINGPIGGFGGTAGVISNKELKNKEIVDGIPNIIGCKHTTIHKITNPTCTNNGEDIEMCSKCGYVVGISVLPKLNHN